MRFGVKAVFGIETIFSDGRAPGVLYEILIIHVDAETEEEALERAVELLCENEWHSDAPTPYILRQTETLLGICGVCEMGAPMESHEVWYEYMATNPQCEFLRVPKGRG